MSSVPSAADTLTAQVVCRARPGVTLTFTLSGPEATLGRESGLAVSLPMDGVSRHHAKISYDGRHYWVEDLKSTNGTFLNGQAVERERLKHLDVITLGQKVDVIFVLRRRDRALARTQGIVRASLVPEDGSLPHDLPVGEITLGRSTSNNVVCDNGAISKVHARIERTAEQLVLHDLGSANGTFVNGQRVRMALLRDGDVISLSGVESFRVSAEAGEVISATGLVRRPVVEEPAEAEEARRLSASDWRTKLEWNPAEIEAIGEMRKANERGTLRPGQVAAAPPKPAAPREAAGPRTLKPGERKVGVPEAPKPAAVPPPAPAPAPKPAPAPPAAAKPAAPASGPPPARPELPTMKPAPGAMPPARKAPAVPAPAPAPAPAKPIAEVQLISALGAFMVREPGEHLLGRSTEVALRVNHPTVSRRHAAVVLSADRMQAFVKNAGGANGTRLNGVEVETQQPLNTGDVIGLGEVELKVTLKRP